ncbi:hypothetical protein B0O80DRAFT_115796 [Mortierella sp. GBAus27b]|nr:hypothetical protein BGX31_009535 [Mortierella sp. GBA43]KAI8351324.1 hypothetical protein B0O80DRAFT_115796 [Mortierella sp. GBAus27b]
MGNTKSRHALIGGRKHGKHSKHGSRNLDPFHSNNNFNSISTPDGYPPQSALQYDSGHYSIGSIGHPVHPEFTPGPYHPNIANLGRMDHQKKPSDSSLHLQYGSRVKRAAAAQGTAAHGHGHGHGHGGGHGVVYNGSLKTTGAPHSYMSSAMGDHAFYNNFSLPTGQEMVYQYPYRGVDSRHSRMSSYQHHASQLQPYTAPPPGYQSHHHYDQYLRMANGSPTPMNGHGRNMDGMDGKISPMGAMTQHGHDGMLYQQQLPQQQQQDYMGSSYNNQPMHSYQSKGMPVVHDTMDPRIMNGYAYADPRNTPSHMNTKSGAPTPAPRAADVLAGAGPLVDGGLLSAERQLGPDDVFARVLKQYPNPPEVDKRERVYRWQDHVIRALTFNQEANVPGCIIPVNPDELDHPDSPYYLDRITYELDLLAPVAKPFKRVIDVNCASGDWTLDLAMRYPRTTVYALDPSLNMARLPPRTPENCRFKMRDVKDQVGEFDLVHQRLGAFRTPILEWTPHFAELGRLTRAGGWIQLAECNGMIVRAGAESLKLNRWVEKAALSIGLNPSQMVEALMPTVLGAGLINVECYEYAIPLGDWGGRRGTQAMRMYLSLVESLREKIIQMNRLEEGMLEETLAKVKRECAMENAELMMKVICAQKPPVTDDLWR